MKLIIDIPNYNNINDIQNGSIACSQVLRAVKNGIPYEEISQCECVEEIIDELESRKDYGTEYAQAMEDVIVILKAKFGIDKDGDNE